MELAYAKWEIYWNNMGEILGRGKPKKKKGKILPLVKIGQEKLELGIPV